MNFITLETNLYNADPFRMRVVSLLHLIVHRVAHHLAQELLLVHEAVGRADSVRQRAVEVSDGLRTVQHTFPVAGLKGEEKYFMNEMQKRWSEVPSSMYIVNILAIALGPEQ
jgi:hypothetical protein